MKKGFGWYTACWVILFAVFQAVCFLAAGGPERTTTFWGGYGFFCSAFLGQLICAYFAFRAESGKKMFYRLPLITVSYTGLILMLIFGGATMWIPGIPVWAGALACLLVLAFTAISVLKAAAAGEAVAAMDEKLDRQTAFLKKLILDAGNLAERAEGEEVKAECRKVWEAARYADPMSCEALAGQEAAIAMKMRELTAAVAGREEEAAVQTAREAVWLIAERNAACRALK